MIQGFHSEEDVKVKFLLPFLARHGYASDCMDFEVPIEVHEGRKRRTIFADLVVYADSSRQAPILVCDTKAPSEILNRSAREQVISYARLLPRIAPLALLTNGSQVQVYRSLDKSRVGELPNRSALDADLVDFVVGKERLRVLREEAKHELFIIDDVRTFKGILKACHNEIRNNEGLDPTAAFDEMSKVLFCKLYEEKENPKGNRFRLSVFDDSMERLHINIVAKILEEAKQSPGYREIFTREARISLKDRTIRRLVQLLENYDLGLTAFDVKGEAFEFFLGETFTGGLGEFFTPRNPVEFMVEAINPKIGERIIDPFCGTGGFLIYAFDVVSDKIRLNEFSDAEKDRWRLELSGRCLFGTDWKERTSQACKMNMMVHGDGSSGIYMHDGFIDIPGAIEEGQFDVCLTNPPFGSIETDPAVLNRYELGSGRKSQDRVILAVERAIRLVKPGGRVGIVVIDGVLNNASNQYVRDYIRRNVWVRGVVSLPRATFEGYGARAKTSILFLEKKAEPDDGRQEPVFMAIAANTGLAANGNEIPGNELPDILLDYRDFCAGDALVPHAVSWVCGKIGNRLDAEYYHEYRAADRVPLASIRESLRESFQRTQSALDALSEIEQRLAAVPMSRAKVGDLVVEMRDQHRLVNDSSYQILGVRWWGGGTFVREIKQGRDVKSQSLFMVRAGEIIYNRLFAFRGSFAVVPEEHDGCFVSSEFPTFRIADNIPQPEVAARYIVHCMNSPRYLARMDALSTGSTNTSRNRLSQELFRDMEIPLPQSWPDLAIVVNLLEEADALRREIEGMTELSKDFRDGVLDLLPSSEAVTYGPDDSEPVFTRDDFFEALDKVSRPLDDRSGATPDQGTTETSE